MRVTQHEMDTNHDRIVEGAARLMESHIGDVEAALGVRSAADPLSSLREALAPLAGTTMAPPARVTSRTAAKLSKSSNH